MKRYVLTSGRFGDGGMEEHPSGEYVKWEDVRTFILDLETGNCTKCHGEKKTQGGILCMRCRMETL